MRPFFQAIGRWGPIALSGAAMLLLAFAYFTGFERGLKDEGAAAHTWQLLIALQLPLIVIFLATAEWRRPLGVLKVLGLQAAALALAMAPVAMLRF